MNEWNDGSLINGELIDEMDETTLDLILKILEKVN